MKIRSLKPLQWVGSSRADLKAFPLGAQDEAGYALYLAQSGGRHQKAKPLKGLGTGVLEVVIDHRGDTFRAVYTVRFALAVYVLHAFQQKAKRGISTPKQEIELVRERLKTALAHYERHYAKDDPNGPSQGH